MRPAVIGCLAVAACTDFSRGFGALEQAVVSPTYGEEPVAPQTTGHPWLDAIDGRGSFDGNHYWIVWRNNALHAARVSAAGVVLDDPNITLAGPQNVWISDNTFDGVSHAVVWTEQQDNDIRFARYADDGTVVQPVRVVATSSSLVQDLHAVAAADGLVLVVWTANGSPGETGAVRVAGDGTVLDAPAIVLDPGPGAGLRGSGVATDGTDFLVAIPINTQSIVRATRLAHDGGVLDPGLGIVVVQDAGFTGSATAVFGAQNYAVFASVAPIGSGGSIVGQRVARDGGLVSGTFTVASGPSQLAFPTAAFDGTVFWVEYTDFRRDPTYGDVYVARVDASGAPLDPSGVEVARSGTERETGTIVAGPGVRLALWDDSRWGVNIGYFVWAAALDSNAQVQAVPALVARGVTARLAPSVATDGTRYTVTWIDERNGNDVYAGHFALDGRPLDDGGFPVGFQGNTIERSEVVTFDGGDLIVFTSDVSDGGLMVAAVDAAGATVVQRISDVGFFPSVAVGQGQALVAWYLATGGVQAQLIALDGTPLGGAPLTLTTSTGANWPRVMWDGQEYRVLWADFTAPRVVVAERITTAGALLDGNGRPVVLSDVFDFRAVTVNGQTLVAWGALDLPDGGASLYLASLGTGLEPVDAGVLVAELGATDFMDELTYDGTNLIISTGGVLFAVALDGGLVARGSPFARSRPSVAAQSDGGGMVAWEIDPSGGAPDVHVALFGMAPPAPDAGLLDAGPPSDGGTPQRDGGAGLPDAGSQAPRSYAAGCGCTSEVDAPAFLLLLLTAARRGAARVAPSTRAGRRSCHRR